MYKAPQTNRDEKHCNIHFFNQGEELNPQRSYSARGMGDIIQVRSKEEEDKSGSFDQEPFTIINAPPLKGVLSK